MTDHTHRNQPADARSEQPSEEQPRRSKNMHADVQDWDDTCSCEPEPRWQAVAEENERKAREEDANAKE